MNWFTELIGWPWYTFGWPLILGILLFLPLVLFVLRFFGREFDWTSFLLKARYRWPIALSIVFILVCGDVVQIGREANKICREQGGLHIYKTVETEGFYGSSGIKYWSEYGFKYVESGLSKNGVSHWTWVEGKKQHRYVPLPLSRYQWRGPGKRTRINTWIFRSSSRVVDRQTGEKLGQLVWFSVYPGWFERWLLSMFNEHSWTCGENVPKEKQALYGKRYGEDELIKFTLHPKS